MSATGPERKSIAFPKKPGTRQALTEQIGSDGWWLLLAIRSAEAPAWVSEVPAVEILRRVWVQQFWVDEDVIRWRSDQDIPPASVLISSPYETASSSRASNGARYGQVTSVHLTETGDEDLPHLLIHVETTPATTQDMEMTESIHQALAQKHLLPAEHAMDTGYVDGARVVNSQKSYGVNLLGPVTSSPRGPRRAGQGFDHTGFTIDWQARQATCPQGTISCKWTRHPGPHRLRGERASNLANRIVWRVRVAANVRRLSATRVNSWCVHKRSLRLFKQHVNANTRRSLKIAMQFELELKAPFRKRVRAFDLRRSRYIGLAKTHVQHVITATAINVSRLLAWTMGLPRDSTRISRFAALAL